MPNPFYISVLIHTLFGVYTHLFAFKHRIYFKLVSKSMVAKYFTTRTYRKLTIDPQRKQTSYRNERKL